MAELVLERWTVCPTGNLADERVFEVVLQDDSPLDATDRTPRTATVRRLLTRGDPRVLKAHGASLGRVALLTSGKGPDRRILESLSISVESQQEKDLAALGLTLEWYQSVVRPFTRLIGAEYRGQDSLVGRVPVIGQRLDDYLLPRTVRPEGTPSWSATAAVTWQFTGASNSASRTIPTSDAVFFGVTMYDGTGNTVASTIAGFSPGVSYQAMAATGERNYIAVYVGVGTGAQTVVVSGGDAGDGWSCGFRGVNGIDTVTRWSNTTSDSASPASIDITTTSDGLAVGVVMTDTGVTTTDTEVWVAPRNPDAFIICAAASSPGTGGTVSIDWGGGGVPFYMAVGANLLAAAAATFSSRVAGGFVLN